MSPDSRWYEATDSVTALDRSAATFARCFGGRPDGIWAAPGRVNLIGEHVDYNAGLCLPIALPHRTYCAVRRRSDGGLHVASGQGRLPWSGSIVDLDRTVDIDWVRYVAGAVWALRRSGADVPGLEVAVDSDVPIGAGLSSSAALISAVAIAAAELAEWVDPGDPEVGAELAAASVAAETEFVGAPTGGMDQAAALRTVDGHALLLDCRDDTVEHLPFALDAAGLALVVIDTRVTHSNVDGRYGERRRGCERATRLLGTCSLRDVADITRVDDVAGALRPLEGDETYPLARHVVTEIHRVEAAAEELRAARIERLGPLFDASHRSLRDDFAVSCRELDLAIDAARDAGAVGARMTGGGFGGSAIALVPSAGVSTLVTAVDRAFVTARLARPAFLLATAAGPAGRIA